MRAALWAINFARIAVAVAVLIIYVPLLMTVFRTRPFPRKDFLRVAIVLTWTSAICFAIWNEAGRSFGVQTSIFVSPVAGAFSAMLVLGGIFFIATPDTDLTGRRLIAILLGVMAAAVLTVGPILLRG